MKVIQNNDGMVGQQFLQGCSRLMKESQKNAGSFCCVFGSKINYSLTIHTDLTRLRIMIPHVWIAYKLHQFYRFQIPWNQKKTSTLTHLPKNHKSFTCFSGVFPPPEVWTNDDTRHLRHRDVWWGGFFSTEVPFFFTSQNKVWQSKSLKVRKVSWRKLPFTISKHILYIYIYCTLYIYLKYFATFPWWSLLPKRPTITAIVTASGMETAMLSFPGVLLQELCTALLFKSWKANIIQGPKPLLSRSNCRLCIFCCTPIIQLHTTANLALLFPSRFIISSFWRCQTLVALRFHFQLYRLWPTCPPRRGQDVAASYAENVGCTLNSSTIKIDCPRSIWCCGKTLHLSSVSRNFMTSFHASSLFDYLWFRTFPLLSFTLCRLGELAKSYLSSHTHTCHGQKWI